MGVLSSKYPNVQSVEDALNKACESVSNTEFNNLKSSVYTKTETKTQLASIKSDVVINRTTLGTQRKNLLKNTAVSKTINNVTFTVNSDGSVTASQTTAASGNAIINIATNITLKPGTYILTGDDEISKPGLLGRLRFYIGDTIYATNTAYTFDTEVTISLVEIIVFKGININGSKTIYPMLRYADITDSTYEPYKESVDERITENTSDIAVSKSDIALNRTALGYKRKNLLPYPKSIVKGGITFTCDENGYMTGSNTTNDTRQWTSASAQYSMYLEAGTYYFSSFAETVCTNSDGRAYIIANGTQIVGVSTRETHVEKMFTLSEATTIYVMAKVYDGKVAFMIREADIIDDTYEPYQPSLQEQIKALEERISALEGGV